MSGVQPVGGPIASFVLSDEDESDDEETPPHNVAEFNHKVITSPDISTVLHNESYHLLPQSKYSYQTCNTLPVRTRPQITSPQQVHYLSHPSVIIKPNTVSNSSTRNTYTNLVGYNYSPKYSTSSTVPPASGVEPAFNVHKQFSSVGNENINKVPNVFPVLNTICIPPNQPVSDQSNELLILAEEKEKLKRWHSELIKREELLKIKEKAVQVISHDPKSSKTLIDDWYSEDDVAQSEGPWRCAVDDLPRFDPKALVRTYSRKRKSSPLVSQSLSSPSISRDCKNEIKYPFHKRMKTVNTIANGDSSVTIVPVKKDESSYDPLPSAKKMFKEEKSDEKLLYGLKISPSSTPFINLNHLHISNQKFSDPNIQHPRNYINIFSQPKETAPHGHNGHLALVDTRNLQVRSATPKNNAFSLVSSTPCQNSVLLNTQNYEEASCSSVNDNSLGGFNDENKLSLSQNSIEISPKSINDVDILSNPVHLNSSNTAKCMNKRNTLHISEKEQESPQEYNALQVTCRPIPITLNTNLCENSNHFSKTPDAKSPKDTTSAPDSSQTTEPLSRENTSHFLLNITNDAEKIHTKEAIQSTDSSKISSVGAIPYLESTAKPAAEIVKGLCCDTLQSPSESMAVGVDDEDVDDVRESFEDPVVDSGQDVHESASPLNSAPEVGGYDAAGLDCGHTDEVTSTQKAGAEVEAWEQEVETDIQDKRKEIEKPVKTKGRPGRRKGKKASKPRRALSNFADYSDKETMCGMCNDDVTYFGNDFLTHVFKTHNGVARGSDESQEFTPPDRRKAYAAVFASGYKLVCDKCNASFKSGAGYDGHVKFCGKTDDDRFQFCPKCYKQFSVYSITRHVKVCDLQAADLSMTNSEPGESALNLSASGRPVRKSTASFKEKIKNIYENYGSDEGGESNGSDDDAYALSDADDDHNDDDYDCMEEDVQENKKRLKKLNAHNVEKSFLSRYTKSFIAGDIPNVILNQWKIDFKLSKEMNCIYNNCDKSFPNINKFKCHLENCTNKSSDLVYCLLCNFICYSDSSFVMPHLINNHKNIITTSKMKQKISTPRMEQPLASVVLNAWAVKNKDSSLKSYFSAASDWMLQDEAPSSGVVQSVMMSEHEPLHAIPGQKSVSVKEELFLNCGGRITASGWCHQSLESEEDFVAVAVSHPCEAAHQNVLQVWRVGDDEACLRYSVGHTIGEVTDVDWCPQGRLDGDHIGAVAVAASDSPDISVWILPHPRALASTTGSSVYCKEPNLVLHCGGQVTKSYMLNVRWHLKEDSVLLIAATSNDGQLVLWEIDGGSIFSMMGGKTLYPKSVVKAHRGAVTGLAWNPNPALSVLATCGRDHSHILWDAGNFTEGLSMVKRDVVVDTAWMTNTATSIVAYDDSTRDGASTTSFRDCEFFGFLNLSYCKTFGITRQLKSSRFGYCFAHLTASGSCQVVFCMDVHRVAFDKGYKYIIQSYDVKPGRSSDTEALVFQSEPTVLRMTRDSTSSTTDLNNKPLTGPKQKSVDDGENSEEVNAQYFEHSALVEPATLSFSQNYRSRNKLFVGYKCGVARIIKLNAPDF